MMKSNKEKALSFLGLDKEYVEGKGDWLWYDQQGVRKKVLDVTGSYGINLLGHKNPEILETLDEAIHLGPPAFVQGSRNVTQNELSQLLVDYLSSETGTSDWFCEYANTGTEIIEAAIKLAVLNYKRRLDAIKQEIYLSINLTEKTGHPASTLLKSQLSSIDEHGYLLHLENSFHGKTLGSMSVMGNSKFRDSFPSALKSISLAKDGKEILREISKLKIRYYVWNKKKNELREKFLCPVIAFIIEPIQGEAGVWEVPGEVLDTIAKEKKRNDFVLISDEIQAGLFRTGKMASLHHKQNCADIYCFGKALGGGVTKISALCAKKEKFENHFFRFHSSSFGEDSYSAKVALKVLKMIPEHLNGETGNLSGLTKLKESYPDLVSDIRGRGNMWAIELSKKKLRTSFIRKYLEDIDLLGYWVSSVLLNKEGIRIFPTLSAPLAFRIQPSLLFGKKELAFLIRSFERFFTAIEQEDIAYLFDHFLPINHTSSEKALPPRIRKNQFPEGAAVFLCHPVDLAHYSQILGLTSEIPPGDMETIIFDLSGLQKFTPYHACTIESYTGKSVDVVFLGLPFISEVFYQFLRRGNRNQIISIIQNAVDWANKRKAKVIGLGQFTSIITENGLRLNPGNTRITTGNSYTAQTTIESVLMAAKQQNIDLSESKMSVIGAAGNIVSVIAESLLGQVGQLSLVFNRDTLKQSGNRNSIIRLLQNYVQSTKTSPLKNALLNYDLSEDLDYMLDDKTVRRYITIHSDLAPLITSDIVLTGANAPKPFIFKEHLKPGSIIIDIAVPANVEAAVHCDDQFLYLKGGIVELPDINGVQQHLNSVIFPFVNGESYACMAETIGLAFEDQVKNIFTGDLTTAMLKEISSIMTKHGFKLGRLKTERSF